MLIIRFGIGLSKSYFEPMYHIDVKTVLWEVESQRVISFSFLAPPISLNQDPRAQYAQSEDSMRHCWFQKAVLKLIKMGGDRER
jgi:hypothetical protein